jgi:hypothetical protein
MLTIGKLHREGQRNLSQAKALEEKEEGFESS